MAVKRTLGRLLLGAAILALAACNDEAAPGPTTPSGTVPATPTNVTTSNGPGLSQITIAWSSVPGATSYNVYWATTPDVTPLNGTSIAPPSPALGRTHVGLTANTTYYYVVTGVNEFGEGAASAPVQATESDDIAIGGGCLVSSPFEANALRVGFALQSRYQIAHVTASTGGQSSELAVGWTTVCSTKPGFAQYLWAATVSLAGVPRGGATLSLLVTDVNGNRATGTYAFKHDERPTLTIAAPSAFHVARPTLRVAASCQDDDPKGCKAMSVSVEHGPLLVSAQGSSIDATVSLAAYEGTAVTLVFQAQDSAGQGVGASRTPVFVESSGGLTEVATVDGRILDVQPDRILFLNQSTGSSALTIRDRLSGADAVIYDQADHLVQEGFLTPLGAMFLERGGSDPTVLHEWQPGAASDLGNASSLVVKGGYAMFMTEAGLIRRDIIAGVNDVVSAALPEESYNGIADNGDVVYPLGGINRFRNGTSTLLTPDADFPVTDGINVAYRKQNTLAVYYASGEYFLTPGDETPRSPVRDYQVANGWVAYTKSGAPGGYPLQVWSRSPAGEDVQVTRYSSSSTINALGPNGEIVLLNTFGGVTRRYVAVPNYATLRDISSTLGSAFFQNGSLFVTIGRSLFQVNP